jgi:hypothetical protein
MRPGIGLCNPRSARNGSRKYVARRMTASTALETVVIAATIVTPTTVLVTADAATWVKASAAPEADLASYLRVEERELEADG